MPRLVIDNFVTGIKASSGYTSLKNISASEMINFDIDAYGRLTCRRGSVHINSVALASAPVSLARCYYTGTTPREHLIVSIKSTTGLWYLSAGAFVELKNSSNSPASSVDTTGSDNAKYDYAVMSNRIFMGLGEAGKQFWVDISGAAPVLYEHGINDAPPDKPVIEKPEYYTSLYKADLDGDNYEAIYQSIDDMSYGIAVDAVNSKIYWTEYYNGKIRYVDLDGSNPADVVTGLTNPFGISIDTVNDKLYWTDSGTGKIQQSDLDGSNITDIYTGATGLQDIVVDNTNSKIYWIQQILLNPDKIRQAALDGTGIVDIVTGLDTPRHLDLTTSKIYWTDSGAAKVQRANLDGSSSEDLVSGVDPDGIAVDSTNSKVYWADTVADKVTRMELDGTSQENIIDGGDGFDLVVSGSKIYLSIRRQLISNKYYCVVTTFYKDTEAIESRQSERGWESTISLPYRLKITPDSSADEQVTHCRIYCTTGHDTLDEAKSASLYYLDECVEGASVYYEYEDDLGSAIECDDHDVPPIWRLCVNHAGRLWLANDSDSYLYFSKMDSIGSPVLDAFPVDNVGADLTPYKIAVGHEDGDVINGIWASPLGQQLIVFKRNSICIIYGNSPETISASHIIPAAGCAAPFSIASVGGLLFFLAGDKQIWGFNGQSIRPISVDVNPLLADIPVDRLDQCAACVYEDKYMLCYPSGDNENDRVLIYDSSQKYWTSYDWGLNDLSWWKGNETTDADKNRLVGALSGNGYVDYLFTDANGADLTTDNGSAITAVYQTNWIEFPSRNTIITGVYIYPVSTTAVTFSVRIDSDGVNGVAQTFTPAPSNLHRQGCFAKGRVHRIHISADNPPDIERIEIEYVAR